MPVPDPNSLLWISNTGITSSWVVLLSENVSLIKCFVSSSSRSNQRHISSILCLSAFVKVSFGLIPKTKPILASFCGLYFSILRYARFSRRVLIVPLVELYLDPCFSWDSVSSDSKVNEMYILFVILHSLWSGNNVWCSSSVGNVLLFVIWVLLSVIMTAVSSICLIASKIRLCTLDELIGWFFFSGRMSRVHLVVKRLLSIVAVVACSIRLDLHVLCCWYTLVLSLC